MVRRNLFDLLQNAKFDAYTELKRLLDLFDKEESICVGPYYITLKDYIQDQYFRQLSFRGTYTTIDEILAQFQNHKFAGDELNTLFVFCEFLIALLPDEYTALNIDVNKQARAIKDNISAILENTNNELKDIGDSRLIIVEKNKAATQAAEIVEDESVALDVIEYNHYALKGDLESKRKILDAIGKHVEPILKSQKLQNAGYKQLESDMRFLLNNFNVRHNNKEGAKAQDYIVSATDNELEMWYDKIYNTELAVIIINDEIDTHAELESLKSEYKWRT